MLEALAEEDGVSSRSIAERIGMPGRTVRYALSILRSNDFVKMRIVLGDTRRKIYVLNEEAVKSPLFHPFDR
ncbi:MAG: winged helix-turn-helix transcriptional regulator [Euryarchaeota archaeon]|nr:winged helix-turn-helix transcriptional regulator [Euryarchaeota archaeon]